MKLRTSVYSPTLGTFFAENDYSGGLFVEVLLLLYIFCGFGVMCDKYLIPAIEKIKERFNISERLAGSTLLALGSSISLIASNMNAVLLNRVEEIELGLTGILGAAIFEFTVGLAIGCFLIKKNYKLAFSIIARDLIIYLIVLVILYYYLEMKYITMTKCIILFSLWIIYMVYLILTSTTSEDEFVTVDMNLEIKDTFDSNDGGILNKLNTENSQQSYYPDCPVPSSENPIHSTELSKMLQTENIEREEQRKLIEQQNDSKFMRRIKFLKNLETQSSIHTIFKGIIQIFSTPWELLLNLLTPKSYDGYYLFIHFLVPSILIWNVSELELFILEKIIRRLNISANFLGLTITAWGNNAPDMFNVASAMSKGMVDLAVNAAIASEIHNVLLGLALPWLVYNLRMKKPLIFGSNNIYAFTLFFFCFFVLSFIVGFRMNNMKFDNKFAYYLILCYLIFLTIISLMTFC